MQSIINESAALVEAHKIKWLKRLAENNKQTRDNLEYQWKEKLENHIVKIKESQPEIDDKRATRFRKSLGRRLHAMHDSLIVDAPIIEEAAQSFEAYLDEDVAAERHLQSVYPNLTYTHLKMCIGIYLERRWRADHLHLANIECIASSMNKVLRAVLESEEDEAMIKNLVDLHIKRLDDFFELTEAENLSVNADLIEEMTEYKIPTSYDQIVL
jgi:hypothetical protein